MAESKPEKVHVLRCPDCGSEVSGTDLVDVDTHMNRHLKKYGHGKKAVKK